MDPPYLLLHAGVSDADTTFPQGRPRLDRIYLNGYVPNLPVAGQVVQFLTGHLGNPIPSPALMDRIGNRFRSDVAQFVETVGVSTVRFGKGDRKGDLMRPY